VTTATHTIRRLTPSDATELRALRLSALLANPTAFGGSFEDETAQPVADTEQRLAARGDRAVLGAFIDDALVGSVGINRETMAKLAHKAGIWGMYVTPEHRGTGVGRQLLNEAIRVAQSFDGVRQLTLYVNAVNLGAIGLYESLGFVTYGVEPCGMKVDGVFYDEHLMVKVLVDHASSNHATNSVELAPPISGRRALPGLTLAQSELAELMSDISEDQYCAGWLTGLEYDLWALLQSSDAERVGAFSSTHPRDIRRLRELSAVTNGWIVWADHADPDLQHMPLEQWEAHYSAYVLRHNDKRE
jgi:ribosomal protein S18 acetylase RimI-like enzyme